MRRATIRDLRYHFPKVEDMLQGGQEIEITKRKRVIARLVPPSPPKPSTRQPDFLARLKRIYGSKRLRITGAELLAQERERF